MMRRIKGFILLEMMIGLGLGLFLLSILIIVWVGLSKGTHKEIVKLELAQNHFEVVHYLRQLLGGMVLSPICAHTEWLSEHTDSLGVVLHKYLGADISAQAPRMVDSKSVYTNLELGSYSLRILEGSDLIELNYLMPLEVVDHRIVNDDDIRGAKEGRILATNCQNSLMGSYHRMGNGEYRLSSHLIDQVADKLGAGLKVRYYKVNRELLYLVHDHEGYQLVHNFLDGSNHMRLGGVKQLFVNDASQVDHQILNMRVVIMASKGLQNYEHSDDFYIRLLNL